MKLGHTLRVQVTATPDPEPLQIKRLRARNPQQAQRVALLVVEAELASIMERRPRFEDRAELQLLNLKVDRLRRALGFRSLVDIEREAQELSEKARGVEDIVKVTS